MIEIQKIKKEERVEKQKSEKDLNLDDVVLSPKIVVTTTVPAEIYKIIRSETTLTQWIIDRFIEWRRKVL